MSPLSKTGRKVKGSFIREYGTSRGTKFFYAYEHKHPDRGLILGRKKKRSLFG